MKKAFTLVELMVVLGIIALLTAVVIFGVINLQRSARDNQRIAFLGQVNQEINNFQVINLRYPNTNEVSFGQTNITIGTRNVPVTGFFKSGNASDTGNSKYYYQFNAGAYIFCIKLENGAYQSTGVGVLSCPAN